MLRPLRLLDTTIGGMVLHAFTIGGALGLVAALFGLDTRTAFAVIAMLVVRDSMAEGALYWQDRIAMRRIRRRVMREIADDA